MTPDASSGVTVAYPQRSQILTGGYRPSAPSLDPSFRIVKELAEGLSTGNIAFPTFIDATLKIRRALSDPELTAERVAQAISSEPMLAAKLVYVANTVAMSGGGKPVSDVRGAVLRVGYSNVHAIATSVAMGQLLVAKEMRPFLKRAEAVWRHSLDVAAIAFVIARKTTKLNADEALFAGLVHDVGRFYLLSKVPKYTELVKDAVALDAVIDEWHAPIGHAVLGSFGLTDSVLQAVADHESTSYPQSPKTLPDVIMLANALSKTSNPLNRQRTGRSVTGEIRLPELAELLESTADELTSLVAGLCR